MFKEYRKEIEWAGRPLILETGKIARQADGAVMATYGDTKVLCTVKELAEIKGDGPICDHRAPLRTRWGAGGSSEPMIPT